MTPNNSPLEVAENRHKGWGWFDYAIIDQYGARIGADGIAVYIALARFADNSTRKSFPATATIAERTGLSDRQVKRMLALLAEVGLISITRQFDDEGRQRTNLYTLETVPPMQETVGRGDTQSPSGVTHSQGEGDTQSPKQDSYNKTHRNKREPVPLSYAAAASNPPARYLAPVTPSYQATEARGDISPVACKEPSEPEVTIAVPPGTPVNRRPDAPPVLPRPKPGPIPADWAPSPALIERAGRDYPHLTAAKRTALTRRFVLHYQGEGKPAVNWGAKWLEWLDREADYARKDAPPPGPPRRYMNGGSPDANT